MLEQTIWELLEERRPKLTRQALVVADYLKDHPEEVQFMSISSLSNACGVADATIYRFCKQLGFTGYNDMKISLAQSNAASPSFSFTALSPDMNTTALMEHTVFSFQSIISDSFNLLDPDSIDEAARILHASENVYFWGQGGSMVLANDLWVRFSRISTKFHTAGDNHLQLMTASLLTATDAIIFISYSGATHDLIDTLTVAKNNGVKIILITHYPNSPGAELADVILVCGGNESPLEGGSIPVKIAILFVGDVLVHRYALNNNDLVKISQAISSKAMSLKLL